MKVIKTGDGSVTFYSDVYEEAYHSRNGALKESYEKYCRPCRIEELAREESMVILDVGFGLGYNALAALYCARQANRHCDIKIISLEKDLINAGILKNLKIPAKYRDLYRRVLDAAKRGRYFRDKTDIEIIRGDAREQIIIIDESFDAVFLDPFSVRKNPQLWTVDFFKELYKRMKERAILSTYSASTPVRSGLVEAGFYIGEGPGDEMKRGGTVASKSADLVCPDEGMLEKIRNSPERMPYYDPRLDFTAEEIFSCREKLKRK